MNERIVALDIGDARIGVAVSDLTRTIASPVEVIQSVGWGPDTKRIAAICARYETVEVLSGLPLNMDGTEGFQAKKVRGLCQQLEKAGLRVTFMDERLTTVQAEDALIEGGVTREGRRKVVDKVAAAIILQRWLDAQHNAAAQAETQEPKGEETMSENQDSSIIELIDENGQTVQFEHVATLEHEGAYYIALMLLDEDHSSEDDEGELVLMKIDTDDKGEECYVAVEDEALQQVLFEKCMALLEEEFGGDAEDADADSGDDEEA